MKIFVAVGTHPQAFDRLFKALDALKPFHDVFGQTGHSTYIPKSFPSKPFLDEKEFTQRFSWADVIITHGGAGSILHALEAGKKVLVVPRQKRFNEHTNDHQLELAHALGGEGKVIEVVHIQDLGQAIERARTFKPDLETSKHKLVQAITEKLKEWNH